MKGSPSRTNGVGSAVSAGAGDRLGSSAISPGTAETPSAFNTSGGYGDTIVPSENLVQQVAYLKTKLEEEHANYKRKLQAYQDGQQRQAQLVQKLQQKVLASVFSHYKLQPKKIDF